MPDKVKPLIDVTPQWDHDTSIYPDIIRIPMEDGKVIDYRMDTGQPHPSFIDCMNIVRKWHDQDIMVGYQYKPRHEKKPNLWERIQRIRQKRR